MQNLSAAASFQYNLLKKEDFSYSHVIELKLVSGDKIPGLSLATNCFPGEIKHVLIMIGPKVGKVVETYYAQFKEVFEYLAQNDEILSICLVCQAGVFCVYLREGNQAKEEALACLFAKKLWGDFEPTDQFFLTLNNITSAFNINNSIC